MSIDPIAPIVTTAGQASAAREVASSASAGVDAFLGLVERAVGDVNASMSYADQLALLLASGADVDLHQVMVALETASIGLQTALQVRNRALEAYREIMSMTI